MDIIVALFNRQINDTDYSNNVKKIYLETVQFPAEVLHTPGVLFQFFPKTDPIITSTKLYFMLFTLRKCILGKYIATDEFFSGLKTAKRLKLINPDEIDEDAELPAALVEFFKVSNDELEYFQKYFAVYQKKARLALQENGSIGQDMYIRANEEFLLRMIILLKKNHNDIEAHSDLDHLCFGMEVALLNEPPVETDTVEYKIAYEKGQLLYQSLLKEAMEFNKLITQIKLSTSLTVRTVFKEEEEEKVEINKDDELFEIL